MLDKFRQQLPSPCSHGDSVWKRLWFYQRGLSTLQVIWEISVWVCHVITVLYCHLLICLKSLPDSSFFTSFSSDFFYESTNMSNNWKTHFLIKFNLGVVAKVKWFLLVSQETDRLPQLPCCEGPSAESQRAHCGSWSSGGPSQPPVWPQPPPPPGLVSRHGPAFGAYQKQHGGDATLQHSSYGLGAAHSQRSGTAAGKMHVLLLLTPPLNTLWNSSIT